MRCSTSAFAGAFNVQTSNDQRYSTQLAMFYDVVRPLHDMRQHEKNDKNIN